MTFSKAASILMVLVVIGLILGLAGAGSAYVNNLAVLRSTFSNDRNAGAQAASAMQPQAARDGRANWLLAQIAITPAEKQAAFRKILQCCSEYLNLVSQKMSMDVELANEAARLYPDKSEAWYWLAQAQVKTNPQQALEAYTRVVQLDEYNGLVWCYIGRIVEKNEEVQRAEEVYLKCCQNEDPGNEGCYGAGRMAEKRGVLSQAIAYYRLSNWSVALGRADELEKQSKP